MIWFTFILSLVSLGQENFQQEDDLATVIIFRGSGYGTHRFDLWVEDYPLLEPMKSNTSISFQVPAGDLELSTKKTSYLQRGNEYVIAVEAGSVYYLKAESEYTFPVTQLKLVVSNSGQYLKLAPKLKKIFVSGTPSRKDD